MPVSINSLSPAYFFFSPKHLKGLSTFKTRGYLTGSSAQKYATGVKGQGFLPARQLEDAAPLDLFFICGVKWKVCETRLWRGEKRAAWGIVRGGKR